MANSNPLQELECKNCGAPIPTTAKPGETVTCNCCGSTYLMPVEKDDDKKESGEAQ